MADLYYSEILYPIGTNDTNTQQPFPASLEIWLVRFSYVQ